MITPGTALLPLTSPKDAIRNDAVGPSSGLGMRAEADNSSLAKHRPNDRVRAGHRARLSAFARHLGLEGCQNLVARQIRLIVGHQKWPLIVLHRDASPAAQELPSGIRHADRHRAVTPGPVGPIPHPGVYQAKRPVVV